MAFISEITYSVLNHKIGSKNIFEHYFGPFSLTKSYHSPFRKDKKKSVGFFVNRKGEVVYNDFATGVKYNFLKFVSALLKIDEKAAMEDIAKQFGLIKSNVKIVPIKPIEPLKQPKKKSIIVTKRDFTQQDYLYWNQFNISLEELKANNIYSVKSFKIGEYKTNISLNELCYAYLLTDVEESQTYFKIYQPLKTEGKWWYNGPQHLIYGIEHLKFESNTLIITKSVKDYLVLKQLFPDVIALQNESKAASKKCVINSLKKLYKNVFIFFDMDRSGIKAANIYRRCYNVHPFFLIDNKKTIWRNIIYAKKYSVKDPSDFVKRWGIKKLEEYVNKNKCLTQK